MLLTGYYALRGKCSTPPARPARARGTWSFLYFAVKYFPNSCRKSGKRERHRWRAGAGAWSGCVQLLQLRPRP